LLVSLSRGLSLRGFEVRSCDAAGGAYEQLETRWPEVMVLDVAMPGMDGVTFCRLVRDKFTTPILMLTAKDAVEERVTGLEAGADDYLVKPFALDEVVARIHALLRRHQPAGAVQTAWQGIAIDRETWSATRDGVELELTATEFKLLEALLERPGRVCTREHLLESAWGTSDAGTSNVVDAHVANLRKKLEANGGARLIQTVRRVGYKLALE
jgi:two-component system response regulator PrrA